MIAEIVRNLSVACGADQVHAETTTGRCANTGPAVGLMGKPMVRAERGRIEPQRGVQNCCKSPEMQAPDGPGCVNLWRNHAASFRPNRGTEMEYPWKFARSLIDDYLQSVESSEIDRLDRAFALIESPIEAKLLTALAFIDCPLYCDGFSDYRSIPEIATKSPNFENWIGEFPMRYGEFVAIGCQVQIGPYRVDFCILARFATQEIADQIHCIVIECDGHDFHERTKEQARNDRARDRALTAAGFKVFRFTGSEIHADALKCAEEIRKYLCSLEYVSRARREGGR